MPIAQCFPIFVILQSPFRPKKQFFFKNHIFPIFLWQQKLVGGIPTPLKNMTSSVGMMTFPTEWKVIKFHGSSHHQPDKSLLIPRKSLYTILLPWIIFRPHKTRSIFPSPNPSPTARPSHPGPKSRVSSGGRRPRSKVHLGAQKMWLFLEWISPSSYGFYMV